MDLFYNNLTIKILSDLNPISPRQFENLGTMVCFHPTYKLGDVNLYEDKAEFKEWVETSDEIAIYLPLYLLEDCNGLSIKTGLYPETDLVGWVFVTKEKLKDSFGTQLIAENYLLKILQNEVIEYDCYIANDYVGYVIEDNKGQELDSCWGFSDKFDAIEQAKQFCVSYTLS